MSSVVSDAARGSLASAYLAGLAVPVIWGLWIIVTRAGVTSGLAPLDVALLRFAPPALVLLPWFLRGLGKYRRLGLWRGLLIASGAGLPFFLVAASGMRAAPAADIGVLLPGTMPLFVALYAWAGLGERPTPRRALGLLLILLGGALIAGTALLAAGDGRWVGHLLFLAAASLWALYTLALRGSGLTGMEAAALIGVASTLLTLLALAIFGSSLAAAPVESLITQLLVQGLLSGLVALVLYGFAIARLGARASAFSALAPVVACLLAIPVLQEVPSLWQAAGVVLVSVGVFRAMR